MGKGQELGEQHKRRSRANEELTEEAKRKLVKAWGKILPFGAQVVASAAAYTVGITATQLFGFVCKVSCATPVLGPCMGLIGVGFASALAGQASKHTHKMISTSTSPLKKGFWEPVDMDDVVLDAVLGIFMFKAMGGRFSSLMPSDLARPGALAFESIPARADNSEAYAQPSVKRELARIFKRDGCHHCGSHRGPVIGDHMPPNKLVSSTKGTDKFKTIVGELPGVDKVRELIGLAGRTGRPLQRFYPQCQRCSIKQATALRSGKRVLVLHLHAPRYRSEHLAGIFVGIRHNVPPVDFPGQPSDRTRRSVSKWSPLALTAAVPADTVEQDGQGRHNSSNSSSLAVQPLGPPQLLVQELTPTWEMQGYTAAPAPSAPGSSSSNSRSSSSHTQQQQQQHGGHSSRHLGSSQSRSSGQRQERQGAIGAAQMLPGSLGLVQEQLGDVLQQQDRLDSTPLLVSLEGWTAPGSKAKPWPPMHAPEAAKQRAEAAFERFAPGLAR